MNIGCINKRHQPKLFEKKRRVSSSHKRHHTVIYCPTLHPSVSHCIFTSIVGGENMLLFKLMLSSELPALQKIKILDEKEEEK